MVYWEYNLGIKERNMEIKEYTKFKADEILQLYTQVGCERPPLGGRLSQHLQTKTIREESI